MSDKSDDDEVKTEAAAQAKSKKKLRVPVMGKKAIVATAIALPLLVLALGLAYQVKSNSDLKKQNQELSNPQKSAQIETENLKQAVSKLVELPKGTPTVATVVDSNKLKKQAFFKNASNGDRVLLYTDAKKAILYRPSTNKVIEIAPINIGSGTTPAGTSTTPPAKSPTPAPKKTSGSDSTSDASEDQ